MGKCLCACVEKSRHPTPVPTSSLLCVAHPLGTQGKPRFNLIQVSSKKIQCMITIKNLHTHILISLDKILT